MTSIGRQEGEVAMVDLIQTDQRGAYAIQTDQRGAYADFDNRPLSRDPQRVAVSNLPIIDLSPFMDESAREDRMHTARAVRSACINIGFFYVTGHGFTVKELNAVLTQGLSFFALPLEEKMKVLSLNADMPGFVRTGGMDPEKNRDKVVDIKERLSITRELKPGEQVRPESGTGKTQWPPRELLPAFETTMKDYIARLQRVTEALNHAFALRLDLPEDYFDTFYQHPDMTLTMNYLPAGRSFQAQDHAVEFFAARGLHGLYGAAARPKRRVASAQFGRRVDRRDAEGRHLRC
jgi:isopenicillin N synthase-like dioxygenase